ncbi:CCHC-type domain-containing protein [Trichonephila clavipes]|nr:CCHC-type domain-containing protein [Trichonephila clavipes]
MARVITSQSLKILIMRGYSLEEQNTEVIHPTTYNISWEFHFRRNQKILVGLKSLGKKKSIIREEVRSNLTPLTREKPAPSPYRTKRTDESSWRPRSRPRQENRPTQQDTGRKTDLWRTSDNVPIYFHYGRPGHVTRYCRNRWRVFSAARQKKGNQTSTNAEILTLFLIMATILKLTTSVIEVIRRTLDAIHNAANQDLHLIAHLLGPMRKTKTCNLRGR